MGTQQLKRYQKIINSDRFAPLIKNLHIMNILATPNVSRRFAECHLPNVIPLNDYSLYGISHHR